MRCWFAVLLSGTFWFASTGVNHVWPLAWIAPLPLLILIPDMSVGRAALAVFGASAIGALNLVYAYRAMPPAVLMLGVVFIAVSFMLVALAWRAVERRTRSVVSILAFPALLASEEYLISLVSPHGTFGSLGYSQTDLPALIQLASLTGLWGITFIVSLFPVALAIAWRSRKQQRDARAAMIFALLPTGLVFAFGAVRLATQHPANTVRVGLAASDATARYFDAQDPEVALPVIRAYARRATTLADRGAQVIVLPEKFVGVTPAYGDVARSILATAALGRHVTIVAGFNLLSASERRNVADVFGPFGGVALEYDKVHFVPGLEEGYRKGTTVGLIGGLAAPAGVAICKDLDFVPLGRAYARAGIGLLLVPAWDFDKDGWLHSRMAVMRGVEGGYALARCASNGFLTVSDARGRILAERASNKATEVLLNADVPVGPGGTFYSRTGDWFPWICIIAAFLCCGAGIFSPPRHQATKG